MMAATQIFQIIKISIGTGTQGAVVDLQALKSSCNPLAEIRLYIELMTDNYAHKNWVVNVWYVGTLERREKRGNPGEIRG